MAPGTSDHSHPLNVGRLRIRLMLPIAILFLIGGVAISIVLFVMTRDQDRAATDASENVVSALLQVSQRDLQRLAKDYSHWDIAVRNLVIAFNPDWADRNVGSYLEEAFNVSATFVLSGNDQLIFAVVDGEVRGDFDLSEFRAAGLAALTDQTRASIDQEEPLAAGAALKVGDEVFLVAANLITPEYEESPVSPDPTAVLVLAKRLDADFIPLLAEGLNLPDVRYLDLESTGLAASTGVIGPDGKPIGAVGWRPRLPGSELRAVLLPMVAVTILLMAGLVMVHLGLVERTVRNIAGRTELLHQAQKMQSLGQLTGGVAHEFNNLLMIIAGNLELLDKANTRERSNYVERAKRAITKGADLTRQLLAFSRKQPLRPTIIDAQAMIRSAKELMGGIIGERHPIELGCPDDLWPIRVDASQTEHALLNIAINSRDAMTNGGTIKITASNTSVAEARVAGDMHLESGDYVVIEVADSGHGMSAETKEHAFEPFFTTKEIGAGTGLGLSAVYGVVERSGAVVEIDSEVGRGTTVRLYLPRANETIGSNPMQASGDVGTGTA